MSHSTKFDEASPFNRRPAPFGRIGAPGLMLLLLTVWPFQSMRAAFGEEARQTTPVPVQAVNARYEDVPVYIEGLGTVQASNTVTIKTRVDGELQKVLFTEGQDVKKGDLLAVIDPRPYQAALDQATAKIVQDQADLANAQYLLAKDQTLAKQAIATQETVESQQSQVDGLTAKLVQDKAAKEAAEISLSYTQIKSPIDGRTGIRKIDVGNQVHTTDTNGIVVVTQTRPIAVLSSLRESDLEALRQAMRAGPVEVNALTSDRSQKLATGTISLIDNEIDQSSGTIRIKSTFENADDALWPGQFVTLQVREKVLSHALTIPSSALQRGANGFFVYVVNTDNTTAVRPVVPGPISEGSAVISSGLEDNDTVVTEGQYRLEAGTRVSIQTSTAVETNGQKD